MPVKCDEDHIGAQAVMVEWVFAEKNKEGRDGAMQRGGMIDVFGYRNRRFGLIVMLVVYKF